MKKLYIGFFISLAIIIIFIFGNSLKNFINPNLDGNSAPGPTITLNGKSMDHSYESLCWNKNCSEIKQNPPSIPITTVKVGDIIEIAWNKFINKPNRVILNNITTGETVVYHLADSDIEIDMSKQAYPFQYEVIFQWYLGASNDLRGESYLNFKVRTY
ncbi:hypothetical protein [Neobacillus sp. PS3-40]|uniref:hypothetical protein n=1 Tax=Neobacillus sp. PS3-40 TaxID=3070679 RepID=UPI0027E05E38|nr:hypothetical protein [Neobacillus sp. PS3-40]WML44625.1 hypothetical protein RCG20_01545 [Neobacillus sp. PS3-40]